LNYLEINFLYTDGSFRNGIDRYDNDKGYFHRNVLTSCSTCNRMKGTMSFSEFIEITDTIGKTTTERSELRNKYGHTSHQFNAYMFKKGKYLSFNQIEDCIKNKSLLKEEIKLCVKSVINEFPKEFEHFKKQLSTIHKVSKKLTRDIYYKSQWRLWQKSKTSDELITNSLDEIGYMSSIAKNP